MSDATKQLLARYESKRAVRPSTQASTPRDEHLWSYRQAAAVLHCFSPDTLRPLSPQLSHQRPRILLFDDIVYMSGEHSEGLFTLKPSMRREALKELGSRKAMLHALSVNKDRILTPLQKMWEDYLKTGAVPQPETLSYRQLTCLSQIVSWLEGIQNDLPEQAYVLDLVRRKSVLASFEHLVTSDFTGRAAELGLLRQHIGAVPQSISLQAVKSHLASWLKHSSKPFLAIHGPGGIGKSALIGHVLLEQAQLDPQRRIPFAYLAFDQPTLRVERPFTLLVEATAQFELQFPEHAETIKDFHEHVLHFRDSRGALGVRKVFSATRKERIGEVRSIDKSLYRHFGKLLHEIGTRHLGTSQVCNPVLLALDTFEEVQYRDLESLSGFWSMLDIIHDEYPSFRVIISGRSPISMPGREIKKLGSREVAALPLPDSVSLLGRLGVADPTVAQAVAEQVGGNPLSLRLAANVIASDPQAVSAKGIKDLTTRKWVFFQIDEQIIQGQLYRRILAHIHDENVRKLAHPGMVLRRVSPEIILEVLAPLCRLSINGLAEAKRIFEELRREHALVQAGEAGTLLYRPEIRRSMIRLLEQDKFGDVRALHRAAISYYSKRDSVAERAEEMYHRLALGEDDPWSLDARWMKGIEQLVAASLEEYPDRAKAWLASRMNLEVPRSVFEGADAADWERNITRKVQQALSELDTDRALELLSERSDRTEASPLFALEAKTHLLRDDLVSAKAVLEEGIKRVSGSTNRGRLAELFWLQSQVALLGHDPLAADALLERAERAIENGNAIPLMHVLCHRLLLRERHPADYPEPSSQLRWRLNRVCERIDETLIFSVTFVAQLASYLLGDEFPKTTERLNAFITFHTPFPDDILTSENLQGLDEYREVWERLSESDHLTPEDTA